VSDPAATTAGRLIAASGADADAEALRLAYLSLLKLALCDLVAASTTAVQGLPHGELASRELSGEELRTRAEGRDWPLHGLTMTGLLRLDDLQACVETVVRDGVEGDLVETGTWRGGSSILMRATLDSLGSRERTVVVADSFQGFPSGSGSHPHERSLGPYFAAFEFLAIGLEEVQGNFARLGYEHGVEFVPGFFEATLPLHAGRRWSLLRLDGDTYDATMLALRCLYPGLAPGGYVIVDDYGALEECREAVDAFRAEHGIEDPIEEVDWTCARWRRGPGGPQAFPAPPPAREPAAHGAPRERPGRRVPALEELELAREAAELRAQLSEREARLGELERRFSELTTSTSWRLTEPLRELGARVRMLRSR
jgi:O-methyltransferase